jgi:hypothetical protein
MFIRRPDRVKPMRDGSTSICTTSLAEAIGRMPRNIPMLWPQ